MHFKGSYKFQVPPQQVYDAILNPAILKSSIPGCEAAWYPDETHMKVRLLSPIALPGLQGPYDITVRFLERHEPGELVVQAGRKGRIGGTIDTVTQITIADDTSGSLLSYDSTINLDGPIAFVGNPIFLEVFKHSLNTFMKNLNTSIAVYEKQ